MNKEIPQVINKEYLDGLVDSITETYQDEHGINHISGHNLPSKQEIVGIQESLLEIIFPGFSSKTKYHLATVRYKIGELLARIYKDLVDQIERSLVYACTINACCEKCECGAKAHEITQDLLNHIPEIRESMKLDVQAAYDGDPAALSNDEIILSYPGIKAITVQRIAHRLYHSKVPMIPRMMTELIHSNTGIDIHPGAHLGKGVFIDHGTGVVIGETAVIGDGVKIYQGVTLGALSFPKDSCGVIIKGAKRHPSIGNNVTIYSGATILGDIFIGDGTIVGGNVWLTESTEPRTKVTMSPPKNTVRIGKSS